MLKTEKKSYLHIKKPSLFFNSVTKQESNLIILLDQITDPQNFGTILRSAAYLGADCVVLNKSNKPPISAAIAKVSSGASEAIPIFTTKFLKLFLEEAVNNDYKVITTFIEDGERKNKYNTINIEKLKLTQGDNVVLVMGSEGTGISDVLSKSSSVNVNISSGIDVRNKIDRELIDSLNVAVSTGIIIDKICKLIKF